MKRLLFFLLSAVSFLLSACHFFGEGVGGNGNIKSENRQASSFTGVDVSSNIDLHVKQDSAYSVRIETDDNLMEFIEVRVKGDLLEIDIRDNYNLEPTKGINVYVTAPMYKRLSASGACNIYSDNKLTTGDVFDIDISGASSVTLDMKAPKVEAGLSGACKVNLKGETKDLNIDGSGASEIRCFDLMAENVDVDLSGAGHADVFASVSLKAGVSGAGSIKYKGSPSVNQNVSGAGSVSKVD